MKGKYIDTLILMACHSKPVTSKNIHEQLNETIAERKKIMLEWSNSFFARSIDKKDIHEQLKETIAEHKEIMKQLEKIYDRKQARVVMMSDKEAA